MMSQDFESFNDPALRAAVRRVWADERAPIELRQRVAALVPKQASGLSASRRAEPFSLRLRSALYGLAAAAVFVFAVGIVFNDWTGGRGPNRAPRAIALPASSADALFASHDQWVQAPDRRIPRGTIGDLSQAGQELHKRLGFPILAADLPGWKFEGAAVSKIGSIKSGQLFFDSSGKQFVSVFSLPASFIQGFAPGCDYCQANDKHSMAGFATPNGFYCVVGSSNDGTLTLDNVRNLRDMIRPELDKLPVSNPPIAVTLAR